MRRLRNQELVDKEYQCCLCLHVRTGTILLGLWQVIVHVLVMCLLVAIICKPDLVASPAEQSKIESSMNVIALGQKETIIFNDRRPDMHAKILHTKGDPKHPEKDDSLSMVFFGPDGKEHKGNGPEAVRRWRHDRYWGLALTALSLAFSCFLLHGALHERPSYLMPYFCLQVFDFVIAVLSVVGYLSYMPDIKLWIKAKENMPYKHELMMFNHATLIFIVMTVSFLILIVKAYLMGMVWACYKFLVMKASGRLITGTIRIRASVRRNDPESGTTSDSDPLLFEPPKYEEVLKTPANAYMPPPYFRSDATNEEESNVADQEATLTTQTTVDTDQSKPVAK